MGVRFLKLRPAIPHQVVREYVYAYGAVSPGGGQILPLVLPWVDAPLMSMFMVFTAGVFPHEHRNHACNSLEEVTDILCASLYRLGENPALVKSMTCFDWINALNMSSN